MLVNQCRYNTLYALNNINLFYIVTVTCVNESPIMAATSSRRKSDKDYHIICVRNKQFLMTNFKLLIQNEENYKVKWMIVLPIPSYTPNHDLIEGTVSLIF